MTVTAPYVRLRDLNEVLGADSGRLHPALQPEKPLDDTAFQH
ncbi:hypothetical protein ACFLT5_02965 [Chloroflexota bacterium]